MPAPRCVEQGAYANVEVVGEPREGADCHVQLAQFDLLQMLRRDPDLLAELGLRKPSGRPQLRHAPANVSNDSVGIAAPHAFRLRRSGSL